MRQAMAGTRAVVIGQAASVTGSPAPVSDSRRAARQGVLLRAATWWLRHWLRYAEVVGAQWR